MADPISIYPLARDVPDPRDLIYVPPAGVLANLPPNVDLIHEPWPTWDQLQLNSCTAQVVAGAIQFLQMKEQVHTPFEPSRLFIYWNERALEDKVDRNAPVYMRDAIRSVADFGVCPEEMWPYEESRFAEKPSAACYDFARGHESTKYFSVPQDLGAMRACLAEGYPLTIGLVLYTRFHARDTYVTGDIPVPDPSKEKDTGGHALLLVGYDDSRERFIIRNSEGSRFGPNGSGYGTLPYAYAANPALADSLYTIRYQE